MNLRVAVLAYPGRGKETTRGVLGSKSHGCQAEIYSCDGGSDRCGEQSWRPKHERMIAAPKTHSVLKSLYGGSGKADPLRARGRPMFLREETGKCTIGTHRGRDLGIQ
jgi:hypothetical protein